MNKKNLILGGILLLLIIFTFIYEGPWQKWKEGKGKVDNFLSGISLSSINKVEIEKDGNIVSLEKKDDRWKIGGTKDFYASESLSESLEFVLEKIGGKDLELVGENKDKKDDFGTGNFGIKIKVYQSGAEYNFVVGKVALDFSSSFISALSSDKTYKIELNLGFFAENEWRDKKIFSFDKERAQKLRFQYPNRQFWVEKTENVWGGILPYKFPTSEEKINEVLDVLANMQAMEIPEQDFSKTGLEKNLIIVEVVGEGFDNIIMVGNANKEGLRYAKNGDSDNIYLISKEDGDKLDRTIKNLK